MLGPLPIGSQTRQRPPDRLIADLGLGQPLLEGDFGQKVQRPQARGFVESARRVMQQMLQLSQVRLRKKGLAAFGAVGPPLQTVQITGMEGVDDITHTLNTPAIGCGNLARCLLSSAGQQVLSAT